MIKGHVMTLNAKQIQPLQKKLENRLSVLQKTVHHELIHSNHKEYANLAGQVHDIGDESVADLLMDIDLTNVNRHIEEIRQIQRSLKHIKQGDYGLCTDCRETISLARLNATPTAIRCIHCQDLYDKTHRHQSKVSL